MLVSARAAERSEDAGRPALHAPPSGAGSPGTGRAFARMLQDRLAHGGINLSMRRFSQDGIQIFVPERMPPHLLAWQATRARHVHFAAGVPLAGPHARATWRTTLLPDPASLAAFGARTGLAVFDTAGLAARFEFIWVRGPSGWQIDPGSGADAGSEPVRREVTPSPFDVEAVPAALHGMWPASCGRCRRYTLGRNAGPSLALCRRDCLPTIGPF